MKPTGMKKWYPLTLSIIAVCSTNTLATGETETPYITVSGEAEVRVVPDIVVLTLGVETTDDEIANARRINAERVKKLIALAQESGVEPRQIATDFLEIEPVYDYHDGHPQRKLLYYRARITLAITLDKIEGFDDLVVSALENGATHIHQIQFRTSELRKHRDRARSLAIRAAREKADALAGELGQVVSRPLNINEGGSNWWSWYGSSWWGGGRVSTMSQNSIMNAPGPGIGGEEGIAPGTISVTASVSVRFEMGPGGTPGDH
ncbi:MAG: SIMPL domain-containing protein [Phycisphaerae bacterium]|nr:SIMPL domain-containing protein [Phycisphaerae bacterium]